MENNLDNLKILKENIFKEEEKIKELKEKIDRLNIEYTQKRFEYEKLERTTGERGEKMEKLKENRIKKRLNHLG